jgi:hypothetical protein
MFARSLAAFCLLNLVVCPFVHADSEVVVYLSGIASQPQRPLLYMRLELGRLMGAAGYRVEWSDAGQSRVSTESPVAVVELRGVCAAAPVSGAGTKGAPLATTAISGGQIIPFSSVDCTGLTNVIGPPLSNEPGARREFLYGRAMARLIAHELYHVLLKTREHAREGIARPGFTASDLLSERFEFEEVTLARLRPAAGSGSVTAVEPAR